MEENIQSLSVELTIDAQEDIKNIYSYIEIDSQKYALILVEQFLEIFEKLTKIFKTSTPRSKDTRILRSF